MKQRTKSILIYIGGIVTGFILMFLFAFIVNATSNRFNEGVALFDKPGQTIPSPKFYVIQVDEEGNAIAQGHFGTFVLFQAKNGKSFYDGQMIKVPAGKVVRQIGTYRYENTEQMIKTIPIVDFFNK